MPRFLSRPHWTSIRPGFRTGCTPDGPRLRAADASGRGPPLVVPRTAQSAGARDRRVAPAGARADPRRGLRQWAQHGRAGRARHCHGHRAVRHERRAGARARRRRGGRGLGARDAVRGRQLRPGGLTRRDRAPRGRSRRRCASCAAWWRRAARCWSRCPPTNGCGAVTTRSTTTSAATRAARCSVPASRRAGSRCARRTSTRCCLPAAILLRVLDRFNRKTTESSLDLWVPPEPLNWLLERPLQLEAALIGRGGRIPAGLSLLAVFR